MEKLEWKKIVDIIIKKKKHIASIVLAFIIIGCLYTFIITKETYSSSTTLILGTTNVSNIDNNNTQTLIQVATTENHINSRQIATYNSLIKSNAVIKEIKNK